MKIIFLGNWNLGYITLKKLLQRGVSISLVVTNYDKSDRDIYRNKVYDLASSHGIPVYRTYKDIIGLVEQDDIAFSVAYGNEIFKSDILDKIKVYNFHPSYLPYYKGASPIQWQIKNNEKEWGMTCHEIDTGIDTGAIVSRDKYTVNMKKTYEIMLEEYNAFFSDFIQNNIADIVEKADAGEPVKTIDNDRVKANYKPHLVIPSNMYCCTLDEISDYLNQPRVLFFAGNRAELGIMFPIILEMSVHYYVDVIISDTYFTNGKQDLEEKERFIEENKYRVNIIKIYIDDNKDIYFESLPSIYKKVFQYIAKQEQYQYKYALVLGDRIESLGFALAAFYGKIPLVHLAGGDISNIPFFDTSVRHCISKIASLHLPFSEESRRILKQLGEEEERICNIGNPSFDYKRMNLLPSKEQIEADFCIQDKICVIFTYHSAPLKSDETNLKEYIVCLNGVLESNADKIIVTYPNHDPGSSKVINYIDEMNGTERIKIIKSLGTAKFHAIMSEFKAVVVGNSSSGLLETAYYMCPAINIGNRQQDRMRGGNVIDARINKEEIADILNNIIEQYDSKKKDYIQYKTLFGDGTAAKKALAFLRQYDSIPNESLILKRFIRR